MQNQSVKHFDIIQAEVTTFVAPVLTIKVIDKSSAAAAIEAGRTIKAMQKKLEDRRVELVKPMNDQVKFINTLAKDIESPLENAERHLKVQLKAFAEAEEKIRKAAEDKARKEREEEERKIRIAREQEEAEAKRQAQEAKETFARELKEKEEAATMFGLTSSDTAQEAQKELDDRLAKAEAERLAKADREARERAFLAEQEAKKALANEKTKGVRKVWTFEVTDNLAVPREFLTISEKAINAAIAGGLREAPGLRIFQDTQIALGR